MPSFLIRVMLFLSSYFPLGAIFCVQLYQDEPKWAFGISVAVTIGLAGMVSYLWVIRKVNPISIKVAAVNRRDGEAMSYIVTYLLPFLDLPVGTFKEGMSLAIFFVVLGILYINSDMLHINPMLNLFGYHIYEVELESGETASLITKNRVRRGTAVSAVKAGDELYLEAKA